MDIAVFTSRGPKFDWVWIQTELEKIGLWSFTERVFALNEYWFNVPAPVSIIQLPASFFTNATELIEKNGIFEFDNAENAGNAAVNATRKEEHSKREMIKRAITGFLPNYKSVRVVPKYSYVDGHPYLLPVVWMHRAVRAAIKGKTGRNMKSVINGALA